MTTKDKIKNTLDQLADWAKRELDEYERHREVMREIWAAREALEANLEKLKNDLKSEQGTLLDLPVPDDNRFEPGILLVEVRDS